MKQIDRMREGFFHDRRDAWSMALAVEEFERSEAKAVKALGLSDEAIVRVQFSFHALMDGDTVAAYVYITDFPKACYVYELGVNPGYQHQGIGTSILEKVKKDYAGKPVVLECLRPTDADEETPYNKECLHRKAFYERNGFKDTGMYLYTTFVMACGPEIGMEDLDHVISDVADIAQWLNAHTNKSGNRIVDEVNNYLSAMPLFYRHREEIYADPDTFFSSIPLRVYGMGPITLGQLLRAIDNDPAFWLRGDDHRDLVCLFAGNPMTGTLSATTVNLDTGRRGKVLTTGFLRRVHQLVAIKQKYPAPKADQTSGQKN